MNEILCPNCRSMNREGANFCAMCGHHLGEAPSDSAEDSPTVPKSPSTHQTATPEELPANSAQQSLDLYVGRRTDAGRVRDLNEDSLLILNFVWSNKSISRPVGLFVVADGMGGHEGGEIASGLLVGSIGRRAAEMWGPLTALPGESPDDPTLAKEPPDLGAWLNDTIKRGNEEIYERAHEAGYEMGTTVVAALIVGDRAYIAHVGDSRAYRINSEEIERLTVDHSLVESLVLSNQISRDEARDHPQANVIYRTVGDQPQVSVDIKQIRLMPDDMLLLCSDGLSRMISDEMIQQLAIDASSLQAACDALVDAANKAGGEDNISVIIAKPVTQE